MISYNYKYIYFKSLAGRTLPRIVFFEEYIVWRQVFFVSPRIVYHCLFTCVVLFLFKQMYFSSNCSHVRNIKYRILTSVTCKRFHAGHHVTESMSCVALFSCEIHEVQYINKWYISAVSCGTLCNRVDVLCCSASWTNTSSAESSTSSRSVEAEVVDLLTFAHTLCQNKSCCVVSAITLPRT